MDLDIFGCSERRKRCVLTTKRLRAVQYNLEKSIQALKGSAKKEVETVMRSEDMKTQFRNLMKDALKNSKQEIVDAVKEALAGQPAPPAAAGQIKPLDISWTPHWKDSKV